MFLSEQQKLLIIQTFQTHINKTQWVLDNKGLDAKKKDTLLDKIQKMEEIIEILNTKGAK